MTRQRIIAHCLLNAGMIPGGRIEDADAAVLQHFVAEFPDGDFAAWNEDVHDLMAQVLIKKAGMSAINVRQMIEDFVS